MWVKTQKMLTSLLENIYKLRYDNVYCNLLLLRVQPFAKPQNSFISCRCLFCVSFGEATYLAWLTFRNAHFFRITVLRIVWWFAKTSCQACLEIVACIPVFPIQSQWLTKDLFYRRTIQHRVQCKDGPTSQKVLLTRHFFLILLSCCFLLV